MTLYSRCCNAASSAQKPNYLYFAPLLASDCSCDHGASLEIRGKIREKNEKVHQSPCSC